MMELKHILKIIRAERYQNIWLFFELVFVFCILWFCTDFLYSTAVRYFEPKGFDISHTYKIEIGIREDAKQLFSDEENQPLLHDNYWAVINRIENYPAVEDISLSLYSHPYTGSFSGGWFKVDTVSGGAQKKQVSPNFFSVFKVKMDQGRIFDMGENKVVISSDADDLFIEHPVNSVRTIKDGNNPDMIYEVCGVAVKSKRSEYNDYRAIIYIPLNENDLSIADIDICIRVKPGYDKNFIPKFEEEMGDKLDIGPYFFRSVSSIEDYHDEYLGWTGYGDSLKSVFSVSAFLIVNIFLGIIGTFWFRVQSRRGEIALRIALGSTKAKVRSIFFKETILLLFLASIVATILCINIAMIDVLKDIGVPVVERGEDSTDIIRYVINYLITFLFLSVIAVFGVWYPAKKASDTPPAEALKEE